MQDIEPFLARVVAWAGAEDRIVGLVLVGSHSRGAAHEGSDVDIVILSPDRERYFADDAWLGAFGLGEPASVGNEDWGAVQARRAIYQDGLEVEFNFAAPDWARTNPIDPGTRGVMDDGHLILFDKTGLLATLAKALD